MTMTDAQLKELEREFKLPKIFTEYAKWENCHTNIFGKELDHMPNFHTDYNDFYNQLYPTMNYYGFVLLFKEHDDRIEIGWISRVWNIYTRCFTPIHCKNFLKAGTVSAINALREVQLKENNETKRISGKEKETSKNENGEE